MTMVEDGKLHSHLEGPYVAKCVNLENTVFYYHAYTNAHYNVSIT